MAREAQVARLLRLVQMLARRPEGVTVGEMARAEDCSPRTIYRDLDALQAAGFPLFNEKEDRGTSWKFVDGYRHYMPIPFDLNELTSLYYSRGMFEVFRGTALHDSLESLVRKIRSSLSRETLDLVERYEEVFACGQRPVKEYGRVREILQEVNRACSDRCSVDMAYYTLSRDAQTKRRVDPYKVWYYDGALYLIAYCHLREEVRIFALDRIRVASMTDAGFEVPEGFSAEDYMADCFGIIRDEQVEVRVRLTGDAARWVKDRSWHPSQEIQEQGDGSLVAAFRVGGTSEIKRWILGFGPMAEVLAPDSLREELRSDAARMLELYPGEADRPARSKGR